MDGIVHFEIPADDISRAEEFYKSVFGWQIQQFPMDAGEPYYMANTTEVGPDMRPVKPGAINGALFPRHMPGETPILVLEVNSIEEYLKKIEAAGGKAQMEILKIADMGFYTRFLDPEGNVMGLWQNA
jgi:hypothetical protein